MGFIYPGFFPPAANLVNSPAQSAVFPLAVSGDVTNKEINLCLEKKRRARFVFVLPAVTN
jgi:hypothetical protein